MASVATVVVVGVKLPRMPRAERGRRRWIGVSVRRHLLPLVDLVGSQECRRVGARSSPRPDGVWGEKNAPVVPTMGMCGPAALDPAGPCAQGGLLGCCLDGGGAGTEVHAGVCPRGRRQSGGWFSLACPRGGVSRAPRGGVQLGLTPCVGRVHVEFVPRTVPR